MSEESRLESIIESSMRPVAGARQHATGRGWRPRQAVSHGAPTPTRQQPRRGVGRIALLADDRNAQVLHGCFPDVFSDTLTIPSTGERAATAGSLADVLFGSRLGAFTAQADVLFCAVPGGALEAVAIALAPVVTTDLVVVLVCPQTGGAAELARILSARQPSVVVAELGGEALLGLYAEHPEKQPAERPLVDVATLPPTEASRVADLLSGFLDARPVPSVVHTSLRNPLAILYPPIILGSLAMPESQPQTVAAALTPPTLDLVRGLDAERRAVLQAVTGAAEPAELDLEGRQARLLPVLQSPVPRLEDARYLHEAIAFGLVPLVHIGRAAGVDVPIATALIALADLLLHNDYLLYGRRVDPSGLVPARGPTRVDGGAGRDRE